MKTVKYLFVVLVFILVSCNPVLSEIDFAFLYNNWVNSYEEEIPNNPLKIFRPDTYKEFPHSRYRERLTFTQGGNCRYLVLSPNDKHYSLDGKWRTVNQEKNIVEILNTSGELYRKFQIIELKQDLFKLKVIN